MKALCLIILILLLCGYGSAVIMPHTQKSAPLTIEQKYDATVLLLPLDSRPACTKFITDLGNIANIRILMPPKAILDHYKQAGDTATLGDWCKANSNKADALILSMDMLIHGGLLASRHGNTPAENIEAALLVLEDIHQADPALPLYAFHILPRLWPADNESNNKYQKEILQYSKLIDQIYTFENPVDIKKMEKIKTKLPAKIIENYHRVYEENFALNKKLIAMTQNGVLKKLIIGQDDGESFGIPNIVKRQLLHTLTQDGISEEQVFVTKGADEVAQTLLGDINGRLDNTQPKINVQYSDPYTASLVMPYMATSVATTVKEKVKMLHGTIVDNPDEADFILFIYIGSDKNVGHQYVANQRIQALLAQNYKVALVDLSEHFAADETILPVLMQNSAPINQLIAYAGWNTTSNAIGTAMTQATIFTAELKQAVTAEEYYTLYQNNLTFLTNRFLEDYFYLKTSIDAINQSLKSEKTDIYDLKDRYLWANSMLKAEMIHKTYLLKHSISYNRSFTIPLKSGPIAVKVSDLHTTVSFPWERTFEIDLNTEITLEKSST